jgi:hypothetical protein
VLNRDWVEILKSKKDEKLGLKPIEIGTLPKN